MKCKCALERCPRVKEISPRDLSLTLLSRVKQRRRVRKTSVIKTIFHKWRYLIFTAHKKKCGKHILGSVWVVNPLRGSNEDLDTMEYLTVPLQTVPAHCVFFIGQVKVLSQCMEIEGYYVSGLLYIPKRNICTRLCSVEGLTVFGDPARTQSQVLTPGYFRSLEANIWLHLVKTSSADMFLTSYFFKALEELKNCTYWPRNGR